MPVRKSAIDAPGFPSRAILASLFLATRTDPPLHACARADPAFQQLSDPRSGQPLQRQSFQRSGRVPRPLSLSGLYPQFHSKFGGVSPSGSVQGRGPTSPYGVSGCALRISGPSANVSVPVSGRIYDLEVTHRLGRMHEVRRIAPGCAGVRLEGLLAFVKGEVQCARMAELSPL